MYSVFQKATSESEIVEHKEMIYVEGTDLFNLN
jgi:hypothetical protein